jgi:hypothetical protein
MADKTTWEKVQEVFAVTSVPFGKSPVTDPTVWVPSKLNPFWEFKLDVKTSVVDLPDAEPVVTEVFLGRNATTGAEEETTLTEELQDFIVRAWQVSGSDVFDALENEMVNRA